MKYSYVPEVMHSEGPLAAQTYGKNKSRPGWARIAPDDIPNLALGDYMVNIWLPAIELEVEPTTFSAYRSAITCHIAPAIGDLTITQLNRDVIKQFYAQLLTTNSNKGRQPLRKTSVERVHCTIHRALQVLVDADVIPTNPAAGARPKRKKSEQYEIRTWSPDELSRFMDFVSDHRLAALWRVLGWTGMRRGEALALRWHDFRAESRVIAVRRSIGVADRSVYISMPKSAQARVLELDRVTVSMLKKHRQRMAAERRRLKLPAISSDDFIFATQDGGSYHPNGISKVFIQLNEKAELPRIRLHDLRHTHASHLIESGANPKVVQERLGHADVVITLNIYSHLFPTTQRAAIERLAAFYRDGG